MCQELREVAHAKVGDMGEGTHGIKEVDNMLHCTSSSTIKFLKVGTNTLWGKVSQPPQRNMASNYDKLKIKRHFPSPAST